MTMTGNRNITEADIMDPHSIQLSLVTSTAIENECVESVQPCSGTEEEAEQMSSIGQTEPQEVGNEQ